jgi:selT/selW/selH-like putative selenoprotein
VEPELAKGKGGVFDVAADGELVFSKHRDGRYPEPEEIVRALAALKGA